MQQLLAVMENVHKVVNLLYRKLLAAVMEFVTDLLRGGFDNKQRFMVSRYGNKIQVNVTNIFRTSKFILH
jgi:hypothetical protein